LGVVVQAALGLLPDSDLHGALIAPTWIPLAVAAREPNAHGNSGEDALQVHRQVLQMLDAAARRDPAAMHDSALPLLQQADSSPGFARLSPLLQEQALLIAMLGALGDNAPQEA